VRFTPTFTPSSVFFRELDGRGRSIAPERIWAITLPQHPSTRLWTPPNRHLPPSNPLSTPLVQVLTLGNQTLMNRTVQHRDAVPGDLVAEVLAGEADGTGALPMWQRVCSECIKPLSEGAAWSSSALAPNWSMLKK